MFDGATATLNILVDGVPAIVTATSSGTIQLNGVGCAGATTTSTDAILIASSSRDDQVTLVGAFAPGLALGRAHPQLLLRARHGVVGLGA